MAQQNKFPDEGQYPLFKRLKAWAEEMERRLDEAEAKLAAQAPKKPRKRAEKPEE